AREHGHGACAGRPRRRVSPAGGDPHRQLRRRGTGRGILPATGLTAACRPRKDNTMGTRVKEILSWYASENPGVRTNLARMLNHGTLAGTGRMVILPVDQGFEHGPARSFAVNPAAYDPLYHYQLA